MADQTVYLATVGGGGTAANQSNALGPADGLWAGGPVNGSASWAQTWGFTNPTEPRLRTELQSAMVFARKGSNSGNPTLVVRVMRAGVEIATSGSVSITSTTGQSVPVSWTPSTGDFSDGYQLEVTCTAAGGGPSVRNSAEIDYGSWLAKTESATPQGSGTGAVSASGTASGSTTKSGSGTGSAVASGTADGSQPGVPPNTGGGTGSVSVSGAAAGQKMTSGDGAGSAVASGTAAGTAPSEGGSFDPVVRDSTITSMNDVASINVPVPAGTTTDDVVFVFCSVYQSATGPPGITGGNGSWQSPTLLGILNGDQRDWLIVKRVTAGGEPANYVLDTDTGSTANHWTQAIAVTVSGIDPSIPVANLIEDTAHATGTGTAFPAVSVDLTDANPIVFWYSDIYNAGQLANPPAGFTELEDSSGGMLSVSYRKPGSAGTVSTTGSTGSHASSDLHSAALVGVRSGGGAAVPQGSGTGAASMSGTASGTKVTSGSGAGVATAAGTASGSKTTFGSGVGAISVTGVAMGTRSPVGTGVGVVTVAGTASGTAPAVGVNSGSGTGSVTVSGTASGTTAKSGAGAGLVTASGSASGTRNANGTGTGSVSVSGAAAGSTVKSGSGTGSVTVDGTASGTAPAVGVNSGSGVGAVSVSGSASGTSARSGSGIGMVATTGSATGSRSSSGAGTGTVSASGTAGGTAPTVGMASGSGSGSVAATGSASGSVVRSGSGGGSIVVDGSSVGTTVKSGGGVGLVEVSGFATSATMGTPAQNPGVDVHSQVGRARTARSIGRARARSYAGRVKVGEGTAEQ